MKQLRRGAQAPGIRRLTALVLLVFVLGVAAPVWARPAAALPEFTELVKRFGPTVVNISTTQKIKHPKLRQREMPDMPEMPPGHQQAPPPLGELFRHFDPDQIEEFDSQSLGSGFVISPDGYLLTNYHVIKDASEIIVRLTDRREFIAKLIGSDERSDLALIKIEAKDLPVVKLGRDREVEVGEWVLAIGSPFGFDNSATAGIVSAKGRSLPSENYVPFIQTDVAINPGNSGGPLFDLDGNVVGINSQIYSRTGGFMGLSFAIPIDVALDVAEQLKTKGYVARGWLGVLIQDVTRDLAETFGMDKPAGALIARVLPDGPAEKSGLKVGDILIEFNGKPVNTSASLPPLVGRTKVGAKVPVKLIREGKPVSTSVVLGELPAEDDKEKVTKAPPSHGGGDRLGLVVTELTPPQREQYEIESGGVLITEVRSGAGRDAGIREGDVILMLNNEKVSNAARFAELVAGLKSGQMARVLIQRRGGPAFLALKVP